MLIGSFTHGVDPKGRIFIPSKWRDDLGATVYITHGIFVQGDTRCLFGMSDPAWRAFAAKFSSIPETDIKSQTFRRLLFSNAAECELDKQGRILIPPHLREYAGLSGDIMLVGVDNRIEIWNTGSWQEHNARMEKGYNDALSLLAERGI